MTLRRRMVHRFITNALKMNGLVCFITYWLQPLDEGFTWIFLASVMLFIGLSFAWVGSILDFLLDDG